MAFFEELKKLFQTKNQRETEKAKNIENALNSEKEISKKLKKLDDEFKDSLPAEKQYDLEKLFPSVLDLKKKEKTLESDNELKKIAVENLQNDFDMKKNSAIKKSTDKVKAYEDLKTDKVLKTKNKLDELDALFNELKSKSKNKYLGQGVGRSSMAEKTVENLSNQNENQKDSQKNVLGNELEELDKQIEKSNLEMDKALQRIDIEQAKKTKKELEDLKQERDKKALAIEKYNTNVDKKQSAYVLQREKNIENFLSEKDNEKLEKKKAQDEYEKKYGYSGEKLDNYSKRYEIALNFYNSLSPDIAAAALQASPSMKYYLGNYYSKLYSILKQKGSSVNRFY